MVNKRLGDVVKQERLKLNLSQNALAEQAKVSLRTVSDIETYNGNPRLDTRKRKIASTLTFLGGCFAATDI